jgi:hypothetical protein
MVPFLKLHFYPSQDKSIPIHIRSPLFFLQSGKIFPNRTFLVACLFRFLTFSLSPFFSILLPLNNYFPFFPLPHGNEYSPMRLRIRLFTLISFPLLISHVTGKTTSAGFHSHDFFSHQLDFIKVKIASGHCFHSLSYRSDPDP